MQRSLTALFQNNRGLFELAYQKENYLISHAGITNKWLADFSDIRLVQQVRDEDDRSPTLLIRLNKRHNTDCYIKPGKVAEVKVRDALPGLTGKK
jgi:hypothetical protein